MLVLHRLVKARHAATALTGEGARLMGGRWNAAGQAVVYASGSLSLAALETFIHLGDEALALSFVSLSIKVPEGVDVQQCHRPPTGWRAEPAGEASVRYGSRWVRAGRTAVLSVPSVIVPSERNYVINPAHAAFRRLKVESPRAFRFDFRFDPRMWKG